jgi:hypothetical protein
MAERRYQRHTKPQKLVAVLAADMTNLSAAAEATGVARSTLRRWLEDPEYDEMRRKTRDDMSEGARLVAWLAMEHLAEDIRAHKVEPRDLIVAFGVAVDKAQLLTGEATHRIESKDITDVFDDHETRAIVEGARQYLDGAGPGEGAEVAQEAALEGAGS